MAQQNLRPVMFSGGRRTGSWAAALGVLLVVAVALVIAWLLTRPAPAPEAAPAEQQPAVGMSMVVTVPVWDGTHLVSVPVAVGAERVQPAVGMSMVVTAPVWDGATFRAQPVQVVPAPRQGGGYTVTAPVWDGKTFRTQPVEVGGR